MKHRTLAVLLDFALRGAAGLVLASPVVAAIASTGIPRFPEGDRLLFEPGGLMLVEVARALWSAAMPLVRAELVTGLLLGMVLLVPYSLVLVALERRAGTAGELWGEAITRVPPLLALHGLALLTQGGAILAAVALALELREGLVGATSRGADLVAALVLLLGALLVLALAVFRDLASAACVQGSVRSNEALARGFSTLRRAPGRVLRGWVGPLAAVVGLLVAGAWLTGRVDVSRAGAWRIGVVLVVHQAVLFARSVCRAWWLGKALVLVSPQLPTGSSARR